MRNKRQLKTETLKRQISELKEDIEYYSKRLSKSINQLAVIKVSTKKWFDLIGAIDANYDSISYAKSKLKNKQEDLNKRIEK